jgi:hypothetical protein
VTGPSTPELSATTRPSGTASTSPKISILLVDDHELVRAGVQALLESEGDLTDGKPSR